MDKYSKDINTLENTYNNQVIDHVNYKYRIEPRE
jgi:hypothetical protein